MSTIYGHWIISIVEACDKVSLNGHLATKVHNEVSIDTRMAHVTLEYFNSQKENEFKGLLFTSIASVITAAE